MLNRLRPQASPFCPLMHCPPCPKMNINKQIIFKEQIIYSIDNF